MKMNFDITLWVEEENNGITYAAILGEILAREGIDIDISLVPKWMIDETLSSGDTDQMPDMILVNSSSVIQRVRENRELFRPIGDYEEMIDSVLPIAASAVSIDGQCYAYPISGNPVVMYYKDAWLDDMDSRIEWDTFIERSRDTGIFVFPNFRSTLNAIKQTQGVLYYNQDGQITSEGSYEVLELYARLYQEGLINEDYNLNFVEDSHKFIIDLLNDEYHSIIADNTWAQLAEMCGLYVTRIPKFDKPFEASFGGIALMVIDKMNGYNEDVSFILNILGDASISANILATCGLIPVSQHAEDYVDSSAGLGQDNLIGFFIDVLKDAAEVYYGEYSNDLNESLYDCAYAARNNVLEAYEDFLNACDYYGGDVYGGLNYIKIESEPSKKEYYQYEQFSTSGMRVVAYFYNGISGQISNYTYTPHELINVGTQTITVSYTVGGSTSRATLTVTVKERILKGITARWKSYIPCIVGKEITKNDIRVTAMYNVGPDRTVTDFEISPTVFGTNGTHTVTISYEENGTKVSCKLTIDVVSRLESLVVEKLPNKLMYVSGEYFDGNGMKVSAHYSDGSSVLLPNGYVKVSPNPIKFKSGEDSKELTLAYTAYGYTANAKIKVYKKTGVQLDDCNITQDMGTCGTGTVNLYSGKLRYEFDDYFGTDTVTPIRIAHLYGTDNGNTHGVGNNWRLNIQQELIYNDGHWHYINKDGDEIVFDNGFTSGVGRSSIRNEKTGLDLFKNDQTVTLIDRSNNSLVFELIEDVYRLTSVHIFPSTPAKPIDEYSMQIEYNGALPVSVTAGRKIDNKRPTVKLIYTGGLLSALEYEYDGTVKIAEYTYKNADLLTFEKLNGNVNSPYSVTAKFVRSSGYFEIYDLASSDGAGNYKCLRYKFSSDEKVSRIEKGYTTSDIDSTDITYGGRTNTVDKTTADVAEYTTTENNGAVTVTSFCAFGVVSQYVYEKGDGADGYAKPKTVYSANSRGFDYISIAERYSDTLDKFHDDFESGSCGWAHGSTSVKYSVNGKYSLMSNTSDSKLQKSYTVTSIQSIGRTMFLSLWALTDSGNITVTVKIARGAAAGEFTHTLKSGLGKKWHFTAFCLGKLYDGDIITVTVGSSNTVYIDDIRITEAPYEIPDDIPDTVYDSFGNMTVSYEYNPVAGAVLSTHYSYNSNHQIINKYTQKSGTTLNRTEYEYLLVPDDYGKDTRANAALIDSGLISSVKNYGKNSSVHTEQNYTYDGYVQSTINGTDGVTVRYSQDINKSSITIEGDSECPSIVNQTETYDNSDFVKTVIGGEYKSTYEYVENGSLKTAKFGYDKTSDSYSSELCFEYDSFGNMRSARIGDVDLITLDYDSKHLNSETYANGCVISYSYDNKNMITAIEKNGEPFADIEYSYDAENTVTVKHTSGLTYTRRSINVRGLTNGFSAEFDDDAGNGLRVLGGAASRAGNITKTAYFIESGDYPFETCMHHTDWSGQLTEIERLGHGARSVYSYDNLYHLNKKTVNLNGKSYITEYTYVSLGGGRFSDKTSTETFTIDKTLQYKSTYNYGKTGNLVSINKQSVPKNKYTYDSRDRLVWEHNYALGTATKYFYDSNGNITQKQTYDIIDGVIGGTPRKTDKYDYSTVTVNSGQNSAWHDQLKSYNGIVIEYDKCGNPTLYKGKVLSWQGNILKNVDGIAMEYDYNGMRIRKGSKKYYRYEDRLIFENDGATKIYYYYDESGISGINVNGKDYIFKKNIFGDVEEIYDDNGVLQCRYEYDAWGNHSIYDPVGNLITPETDHIGNINPIRYRSYYWDNEFGLYYLKTRYYDPELNRFISPDSVEYADPANTSGFNLYAYCNNNPVMYTDPDGTFVSTILGFLFGGLWGGLTALSQGKDFWEGALTGAISGMLSGLAVDVAAAFSVLTSGAVSIIGGAIIASGGGFIAGLVGELIGQGIRGEDININIALKVGAITAATNLIAFGVSSLVSKVSEDTTANLFKMLLPKYTPLWSWLFQGLFGWVMPYFATTPAMIESSNEKITIGAYV